MATATPTHTHTYVHPGQAHALPALAAADPEIYEAIRNEERRQVEKIELIASEN